MQGTSELTHAIGRTPLILLRSFSEQVGARVLVKYEAANPGASLKDRAALWMINRAEREGIIAPSRSVLIEPTSGNTGIAIAMIGAVRGYRVILVMPESMSVERRKLAAAYGAEVVLTPAELGMQGSVAKAEELRDAFHSGWIVGQFTNPNNPLAHERTTAPEIFEQLGFDPDYVLAGVGTGGTISGCAHYFAQKHARTKCYAVEPAESPIISQALAGEELTPHAHGIQGIGANFIPETLDLGALAGALQVPTEDAIEAARSTARDEGLLLGISTGANLAAVLELIENDRDARGSTIVTFAVDTGERYLSTDLFHGLG